jgi:hypothetical protein
MRYLEAKIWPRRRRLFIAALTSLSLPIWGSCVLAIVVFLVAIEMHWVAGFKALIMALHLQGLGRSFSPGSQAWVGKSEVSWAE